MSRAGFRRLQGKVTRSYRKKGYSPARARYIGRATAGEVAREKHAKRRPTTRRRRRRTLPPRDRRGRFRRRRR